MVLIEVPSHKGHWRTVLCVLSGDLGQSVCVCRYRIDLFRYQTGKVECGAEFIEPIGPYAVVHNVMHAAGKIGWPDAARGWQRQRQRRRTVGLRLAAVVLLQ